MLKRLVLYLAHRLGLTVLDLDQIEREYLAACLFLGAANCPLPKSAHASEASCYMARRMGILAELDGVVREYERGMTLRN